jgi:hypothetical protein
VNIPGQFQEITVLIYQYGFVSALKDVAAFMALDIIIGSIGRIYIVHDFGEIGLCGFQQQMIMVVH